MNIGALIGLKEQNSILASIEIADETAIFAEFIQSIFLKMIVIIHNAYSTISRPNRPSMNVFCSHIVNVYLLVGAPIFGHHSIAA